MKLACPLRCMVACLLGIVGCVAAPSNPSTQHEDAEASAAEMMAAYEGMSHADLAKHLGAAPVSKTYRKRGHKYEALFTVEPDVEHPPHGIQVVFTVFDGDKDPTMTPIDHTFYLRPAEKLSLPKSAK